MVKAPTILSANIIGPTNPISDVFFDLISICTVMRHAAWNGRTWLRSNCKAKPGQKPFYTNQPLHQAGFTQNKSPGSFSYTNQFLHQTTFAPNSICKNNFCPNFFLHRIALTTTASLKSSTNVPKQHQKQKRKMQSNVIRETIVKPDCTISKTQSTKE